MGQNICRERSKVCAQGNKLNTEIENGTEFADVLSNQEQSSSIYKLPNEILIDIFDRLKLDDLSAIYQVSKHFQRLASYCFLQNYSEALAFRSARDNIVCSNNRIGCIKIDVFSPFIRRLNVKSQQLQGFLDKQSNFPQLREISLFKDSFTNDQIHCMTETLSKVKTIRIECAEAEKGFLANMLAVTPNIMDLVVIESKFPNEFLSCKYSTLKRFHIWQKKSVLITPFLELNPTIKTFVINSNGLWKNRKQLKIANIALDDLEVYIDIQKNIEKMQSFCQLLNTLHANGLYKRLSCTLLTPPIEQGMVDELASLSALVKINMYQFTERTQIRYVIPSLQTLKELCFFTIDVISDLEAMASNLHNLERIFFCFVPDLNAILPLIRRAANLTKLKIQYVKDGSCPIINIFAFNRERKKLPNAKKLTLYVAEKNYLATKWAMQETDLDLIKVQRASSFEWTNFLQADTL